MVDEQKGASHLTPLFEIKNLSMEVGVKYLFSNEKAKPRLSTHIVQEDFPPDSFLRKSFQRTY